MIPAAILLVLILVAIWLPKSARPDYTHRWGNGAPRDNPFVSAPEGSCRLSSAVARGWKPPEDEGTDGR